MEGRIEKSASRQNICFWRDAFLWSTSAHPDHDATVSCNWNVYVSNDLPKDVVKIP